MSKQLEKLKQIKLVALDIDGTSMNSNSVVTENTQKVIQQLADKYIVVPTTGRGFFRLREDILKVNHIRYVISANGAVVTDAKEQKRIFESLIPYEVASSIVEKYVGNNTLIYIHRNDRYSTHYFSCLNQDIYDAYFKKDFKISFDDVRNLNLIEFLNTDKRDVLKIGIRFIDENVLLQAKKDIEKQFLEVNVFSVGNMGLEITEKTASKKNALEKLCSYLNIGKNETLAIGDNGNDTEMLAWAGVGVAMQNAVEPTKKVADFICGDNDHEGAAKFFEKNLL